MDVRVNIKEGPAQDYDNLHINLSKRHITGYLNVYRFRDKDTKQVVIYIPSLELSGYGENNDKATEMATHALSDYLTSFLTSSLDKIDAELKSLGWNRNIFRRKDFSNELVDIDIKLRELNAENGSVEHLALEAA